MFYLERVLPAQGSLLTPDVLLLVQLLQELSKDGSINVLGHLPQKEPVSKLKDEDDHQENTAVEEPGDEAVDDSSVPHLSVPGGAGHVLPLAAFLPDHAGPGVRHEDQDCPGGGEDKTDQDRPGKGED